MTHSGVTGSGIIANPTSLASRRKLDLLANHQTDGKYFERITALHGLGPVYMKGVYNPHRRVTLLGGLLSCFVFSSFVYMQGRVTLGGG